ncbi:hybrid sensor histidine kinase/response regulator [Neorhizobium lilium]|uniref:histidine kinase n=1 Tax=Neorhizobium lilium TaxID=2503024 RepID=A0A3S3RXI5_9HYPH|nr:response regulator [Neorhizobium lilium]RWX80801.1 hybrid sensor histidine kinase/response regulator [Neorhizobium lilium]
MTPNDHKQRLMAKSRPFLLLALAALIPVAIISGVIDVYVIQARKATLEQVLRERAGYAAAALSKEVSMQIQLLTMLSDSPRLDPPVDRRDFLELAGRMRMRIPAWQIIRVTDPRGRILLSNPPLHSGPGAVVVEADSNDRVFDTGKPAIGNVVRGPGGLAAFPVRVPVSRDGKTVYGLTAVIAAQTLTDVLRSNGLPVTWAAWIESESGTLLASSVGNVDFVGGPVAALRKTPVFDGLGLTQMADGEELQSYSAKVDGLPWRVTLGMPLGQYQALSAQSFRFLVLIVMLTAVLSSFAIWLFVRELRARRIEEAAIANWQRMDALGRLTGGVAHDFNNLLMVFQSGVESIRRRRNDEKRLDQVLNMMVEAVDRGKSMTQRLLSFSRRSNRGAETILLQKPIGDAEKLFQQAALDNVTLNMAIDRDLWPVTIDPQALTTALINIVTNAREAMASGGGVTIKARNVQDLFAETKKLVGPGIVITVSDDGPGIPRQYVHRVFEPFFTTKGAAASGLGLTQVYSFAERSGGMATAANGDSRGSSISIYLPRASGEAVLAASPEASAPFLPRKVLIVDDNAASLQAARLGVEELGLEVAAAGSGQEALAILDGAQDLDLVLSDVMMPGMNGLQLRDEVRRRFPAIGFALMTGYSEDLEAGAKAGVPVLSKPFTADELRYALVRAMEDRDRKAENVIPLWRVATAD